MYSIEQLAKITGLTTRTLRNYLHSGVLAGTKESGIWQFSEEQVEAFLTVPAVKKSIHANRQAIIYDFSAGFDCTPNEICLLLNRTLPLPDAKKLADFFCSATNASEHIRFSYSYEKSTAHFILKGAEAEIKAILTAYWEQFPSDALSKQRFPMISNCLS